jgi:hypothetical protein
MNRVKVFLAVLISAGMGFPQAPKPAGHPTTAGATFEKLKSLVGEWEGSFKEGGQQIPATTSFRLVSDGSALMNVLGAGTPHEMVTMIHLDNGDLLATHYCAAHNQPRFRLVPSSEPNVVTFEFKDATNLPSPTAPLQPEGDLGRGEVRMFEMRSWKCCSARSASHLRPPVS